MKFDSEVRREIKKIATGCLMCTAIMLIVFWAIGQFDYTVALGCVFGFILSFGNFCLMSQDVASALETGDETTAKVKLRRSYVTRTVLQITLIAIALALDFINPVPVMLAVFYPRITITVCNIFNTYAKKGIAGSTDYVETKVHAVIDEVGDVPDEFEKFVSGFYKSGRNSLSNTEK